MERQERERRFWERSARKFNDLMEDDSDETTSLADWINGFLNPEDHVIELAAGTGRISLAIAPYVNSVTGCDISPSMIDIASGKLAKSGLSNCGFQVGDAYHPNFPEASFDAVIITNALHVMLHPEKVLSAIGRLLKPEGILIASVYCHNRNFLTRLVSKIVSLYGFKVFHRWKIESFEKFVDNNGYKIQNKIVYDSFFPLVCITANHEGLL